MAQTTQTFRIFVSSTFSDLKPERDALQKNVFPRLRELCIQHGCRFQAIDLRWGVSEDAARGQQTMKICLEEIKRCQRTTPRPNFIVLLGDRYGWCPLPYDIPADEFERIQLLTNNHRDSELLTAWYRRDDNAIPAVYNLQPRDVDLSLKMSDEEKLIARERESTSWYETERLLRQILRSATADLPLTDEQRLKYEASATEQEIEVGAMKSDDANEHVFCFFRTIRNVPNDDSAKDFVDLKNNHEGFELDSEGHQQQYAIKKILRARLPKNIFDYEAEWIGPSQRNSAPSNLTAKVIEAIYNRLGELAKERGPAELLAEDWENLKATKASALREVANEILADAIRIDSPISLEHIPDLCADVFLSLAKVILQEIGRLGETDLLDKEIKSHNEFGKDRAGFFVGRRGYLDQISNYLRSTATHTLVLSGESGSGKSALMARAIEDARNRHPSAHFVQRFIGATPISSDGRRLLESLCKEIGQKYGDDKQSLPSGYQELVKEFLQRVEQATEDEPLIIFLDAVDQLSDNEQVPNLAWLPRELPLHVHFIVSTLPGECLTSLGRRLPADNLLKLEPMTPSDGETLLDLWLADAKRRLQPAQREEALREFVANGLPLYLKLVFEQARLWRSYNPAQRFPADIPGMIRAMLRRLMVDHGLMMVDRALGYIAAARHGLSEDELLDVLSLDKEVFDDFLHRAQHQPPEQRLPVVVWSRLYFDLEPYLTERSADGSKLFGFYHRQVSDVVAEQFLANGSKRERQTALADFFAGQDYFFETIEAQRERSSKLPPTPRHANLRKASELAWQVLRSGRWEQLELLLTKLSFLEAKVEAGMVFDLTSDFSAIVKAMPPNSLGLRNLLLLREAIRTDIHFIARHPTTLFQCLWNRCWWYDNAESAKHYDARDGEASLEAPPWERQGQGLSALMELWYSQKENETPGFFWVQSQRPPTLHLGSGQQAIFRGHAGPVQGLVVSGTDQLIISGSQDQTIRVWDAEAATELLLIRHEIAEDTNEAFRQGSMAREVMRRLHGGVLSVAYCSERNLIASGADDGTVRIWDALTGNQLKPLTGHQSWVESVVFAPTGQQIASGSDDNTIRIWDPDRGVELLCLRGHENWVTSVAYSPDGKRLVSGGLDCTVRVWDSTTGQELACLGGHTQGVLCVSFSPDGQRIASGSVDRTVRVWDANTGLEIVNIRGHSDQVRSVAFSHDGQMLASGSGNHRYILEKSYDNSVRVWNAETGEPRACFRGHTGEVCIVTFSSNDEGVISGSWDGTIRLWEITSAADALQLRSHSENIVLLDFSPDGARIASGSVDRTIRIWQASDGVELACLPHERDVRCMAFSPDSMVLACGGGDDLIRVRGTGAAARELFLPTSLEDLVKWRSGLPFEIDRLAGHKGPVDCLSFSSDGNRIVSGSGNTAPYMVREFDYTVRVWDTVFWEEVACFGGHSKPLCEVSFSPDGLRVVSVALEPEILLWSVETGALLHRLTGHSELCTSASFSPDGKFIVSGSADMTVRVWNTANGAEIRCLRGHTKRLYQVKFSADGTSIASGSADGSIRIWNAQTGACDEVIEGRGDIVAIAAGAAKFPWRAIHSGLETRIESSTTSTVAGWLAGEHRLLSTHPTGWSWAAADGKHLCLFVLRGGEDGGRALIEADRNQTNSVELPQSPNELYSAMTRQSEEASRLNTESQHAIDKSKAIPWWKKLWKKT